MNKRIITSFTVFVLTAVLGLTAGATVFPDADGSHDISSAAAWGGTLPSASSTVVITNAGESTFNFQSPATFGMLWFYNMVKNGVTKTNRAHVLFDQSAVENPPLVNFSGFTTSNSYVTTEFRGGAYNFNGGVIREPTGAGYHGWNFLLSGGCVISDASGVQGGQGYGSSGNVLTLTGKSRLDLTANTQMTYGGANNGIVVDGGSVLTSTKNICIDTGFSGGPFTSGANFMVVSNAESKVLCTGIFDIGAGGGARLSVSDGALLHVKDLARFGGSAAYSNVYQVANATMVVDGAFYLGYGGADIDHKCRFEVLEGGILLATNANFYLGGCSQYSTTSGGNALVVSNGTLKVKAWSMGADRGRYNKLVVQGKNAQLVQSTPNAFFGPGPFCELIVEDGADFSFSKFNCSGVPNFSYTGFCSNETVRIRGGGVWRASIGTRHGTRLEGFGNRDNTVSVEAGGSLLDGDVNIGGGNCGLLVSNGIVRVKSVTLGIGNPNDYGGLGTNCWMTVQGDRPEVSVTNGSLVAQHSSTIRYEVPSAGYATNAPLVSASGAITISANSALEIAGLAPNGGTQLVAADARSGIVLLKSGGALTVPENVLAEAQAALPDGYRLRVKGKQLVLDKPLGTTLIVR